LGWAGVHMGYMEYKGLTEGWLKQISLADLHKDTTMSSDTTSVTGKNSVSTPSDYYFYIYLSGNFVGTGGPAEAGEQFVRAVQAYIDIGGQVKWMENQQN
jgi:hypothetical protein